MEYSQWSILTHKLLVCGCSKCCEPALSPPPIYESNHPMRKYGWGSLRMVWVSRGAHKTLSKSVILDCSIMITLPHFLLFDKERQLCLLFPHISWESPREWEAIDRRPRLLSHWPLSRMLRFPRQATSIPRQGEWLKEESKEVNGLVAILRGPWEHFCHIPFIRSKSPTQGQGSRPYSRRTGCPKKSADI